MTCTHDFRHPRGTGRASYIGGMELERAAMRTTPPTDDEANLVWVSGVLGWVAVALPSVADATLRTRLPLAWWVLIGAYVLVFVATMRLPYGARPALASVQVIIGLAAVAVGGTYDLAAVLTVVSAAGLPFWLPPLWCWLVVAGQSIFLAVVALLVRPDLGAWALLGTLAYAALQLFALMMAQLTMRERQHRLDIATLHADLVAAHEELAARHGELVAAQSRLAEASRTEERLRIARDLHDSVGHQLTALSLHLETATHLAAGTPLAEVSVRCRGLAREALTDVRTAVSRLRDPSEGTTGTTGSPGGPPPSAAGCDGTALRARLTELAAGVPRPQVRTSVEGVGPLTAGAYHACASAAQEIITNAVRHSGASELVIDVRGEDGELVLRALDDGRGAEQVVDGNGLAGMRERFARLGGVVTVTTAPGEGFRVVGRLTYDGATL